MSPLLSLGLPAGEAARYLEGWTLADVVGILKRRRAWIRGFSIVLVALATLYCIVANPRYESTAVIEIQKDRTSPFGLETSVMGDETTASSDALDYNVTLETQVEILEADTLALRVIRQEKLEATDDFFGGKPSWLTPVSSLMFWKRPLEPPSTPLDLAPNRRYVALKIFRKHLHVKPVPGTRLIDIAYSDRDPNRAARVVNALVQALIGYGFDAQYAATTQASNWLSGQLADLKKQTELLQERAVNLQRATGMFGDDESHNIVLSRLEALNQTLAAAESNRILKEAIYRTSQGGDPELISGLSGNGVQSAQVQNSLALIQTLRSQEAAVKAEMARDENRYGTRYPKMAELQSELKDVEGSIAQEVHRLGERARTDFEISRHAEQDARASFDRQKALVYQLNDKAVAYALTKQEADESRNLYEGLLGKLKQAGILAGLACSNVSIVSPGLAPPTSHPKSPNVPLLEAAALLGGIFFGSAAAFLRELTDECVNQSAEIEQLTSSPLLASIPLLRRSRGEVNRFRPLKRLGCIPSPGDTSPLFLESFRQLRAALQTHPVTHSAQVIFVTSPVGGEGKSTVALHLAQSFAALETRVLLLQADFRSPLLMEAIPKTAPGLSDVLSHDGAGVDIPASAALPNLHILARGATCARAADLLASRRFRDRMQIWRATYDYIVVDGPGYLPASDGVVLAQTADIALIVVRHQRSTRSEVMECVTKLARQMPSGTATGVVLNAVSMRATEKRIGYAMVH